MGHILQFYGQIVLTEVLKETSDSITDNSILALLNELNRMVPIGQLLYLTDVPEEKKTSIRYTILADLDGELELNKCAGVIMLLMHIYELLCSSLLIFLEEKSVETTIRVINDLLLEEQA